jgi:hypothetical protein
MVVARQEMLRRALALMESALELLDQADCSADVGAHLDLAIWKLREIVPEGLSHLGSGSARAAE